MKACPDVEGEEFDPEDGRRELSPVNERRARDYLRRRFPSLADAPLLGARGLGARSRATGMRTAGGAS